MQINLITVGNLKENYLRDACKEYIKRLQAYAKVSVVEIEEEKKGTTSIRKQKEGEKIQKKLTGDTFVIALVIEGKGFTSEQFAGKINELGTYGNSHLTFIIGGSDGLPMEIITRADLQISFSKMTFPHQLMRVFLLEQIYRAFKIIRGENYHK